MIVVNGGLKNRNPRLPPRIRGLIRPNTRYTPGRGRSDVFTHQRNLIRQPTRTMVPVARIPGCGNYQQMGELDSIFSKIGKAIGKAVKGVARIAVKVAPIAVPLVGGAVLFRVGGKAVGRIIRKSQLPRAPIAFNPGVSLPSAAFQAVPAGPEINRAQPDYASSSSSAPASQAVAPASLVADEAAAPGALPSWALPVGGLALLALVATQKGR